MTARVLAALRLSGDLKAGTPFEMASVPVIALQPPAKARSTRNTSASDVNWLCSTTWLGATGGSPPASQRMVPTMTSPPHRMTKAYVGAAKIRPDSLSPRKLASATTATTASEMINRCW